MSSSGQLYLAIYVFTLVSLALVLGYRTWAAERKEARSRANQRASDSSSR